MSALSQLNHFGNEQGQCRGMSQNVPLAANVSAVRPGRAAIWAAGFQLHRGLVHDHAPKCTIAAEGLSVMWWPGLDLALCVSVGSCRQTGEGAGLARRNEPKRTQ